MLVIAEWATNVINVGAYLHDRRPEVHRLRPNIAVPYLGEAGLRWRIGYRRCALETALGQALAGG